MNLTVSMVLMVIGLLVTLIGLVFIKSDTGTIIGLAFTTVSLFGLYFTFVELEEGGYLRPPTLEVVDELIEEI